MMHQQAWWVSPVPFPPNKGGAAWEGQWVKGNAARVPKLLLKALTTLKNKTFKSPSHSFCMEKSPCNVQKYFKS